MILCHREPTLAEMLSDSIFQAVMKADGVDPDQLAKMLRQTIRGPGAARPADRSPSDQRDAAVTKLP